MGGGVEWDAEQACLVYGLKHETPLHIQYTDTYILRHHTERRTRAADGCHFTNTTWLVITGG